MSAPTAPTTDGPRSGAPSPEQDQSVANHTPTESARSLREKKEREAKEAEAKAAEDKAAQEKEKGAGGTASKKRKTAKAKRDADIANRSERLLEVITRAMTDQPPQEESTLPAEQANVHEAQPQRPSRGRAGNKRAGRNRARQLDPIPLESVSTPNHETK